MSLLTSKGPRRIAAGVSALALVLAAAAPTTVMAQSASGVTLHRSCASGEEGGDPTCLNNLQVAVPIAIQLAVQKAELETSVRNNQRNDVDQTATNRNKAAALNILSQEQ